MYRFSRALYRELAPALKPTPADPDAAGARRELLEACEATVQRLASDPDFAYPARSLFGSVRTRIPVRDQEWAWRLIERYVDLMLQQRRRLEAQLEPPRCSAVSRSGRPCRRDAVRGDRFCPTHRHLGDAGAPVAATR